MAKGSGKQHTDALEAMHDADRHAAGGKDAVPMPENGGHEKSHAAHLGKAHEQTTPADKLKQGMGANTLREPPTVVDRVGKQRKG